MFLHLPEFERDLLLKPWLPLSGRNIRPQTRKALGHEAKTESGTGAAIESRAERKAEVAALATSAE